MESMPMPFFVSNNINNTLKRFSQLIIIALKSQMYLDYLQNNWCKMVLIKI